MLAEGGTEQEMAHASTHEHTVARAHTCTTRTCTRTYTRKHTRTCTTRTTHAHICTCTRTCANMHAHTHTHAQAFKNAFKAGALPPPAAFLSPTSSGPATRSSRVCSTAMHVQVFGITAGVCIASWVLCYLAFDWTGSQFMPGTAGHHLTAAATLGATLMMARSPASAVRSACTCPTRDLRTCVRAYSSSMSCVCVPVPVGAIRF